MPARLCRSEVSPVEQVNRIVKYRESVLNVKSYAIGVFRRLRHEHHCGFRNAVHVSAPNFSTINFLSHRILDTVASKPLLVSSHCRLTGSWHRYLRTRSTGIFRHPGGPAGLEPLGALWAGTDCSRLRRFVTAILIADHTGVS